MLKMIMVMLLNRKFLFFRVFDCGDPQIYVSSYQNRTKIHSFHFLVFDFVGIGHPFLEFSTFYFYKTAINNQPLSLCLSLSHVCCFLPLGGKQFVSGQDF